ncbi:MAG: RES family NAD+ phosphorylase [Devosia nanyangense]|uniref:RES family NAD+ phosphorylase n=1 Tax=Devosia nanyangense TaxID=1228055 RepID=A0A933L5P1_9HYPH|nr:RES family NAD+ phosphorylase [Devosia nanyangense]
MTTPLPPSDLDSLRPTITAIAKGSTFHRFYSLGDGKARYDPIYFDRGRGGRLNAPPAARYGVLYASQNIEGAFAETFLRSRGRTLVPSDLIERKGYATLRATRELAFVNLFGPGLARLGATAEVVHGGMPYDVPQAWSAAIRSMRIKPDGIAYYARHDDEQLCYAIFGPRPRSVAEVRRIEDIDQDWFYDLCQTYDVGVSPRG